MYFVGQVLYYQLNIDYIIETYCVNKEKPELQCNGKCHLAKQLQVSQNDNKTDESAAINVVIEAFYPLFIQLNIFERNSIAFQIFPKKKWFSNPLKTNSFIDELFHPPRLV